MGPLTAQPEIQTNDLLLLGAQLPRQSGNAREIHSVGLLGHPEQDLPESQLRAVEKLGSLVN